MIGANASAANWPAFIPNLTNKSGAATVLGGVYQIDTLQSSAASVDAFTALDNVVNPSTAGINSGVTFCVAQNPAVADGSRTAFLVEGVTQVLLNGTVAIGDNLIPVNAQNYLQTNAGTGPALSVGKALEANVTGPNLKYVHFQGMVARMNQGTT